MAIVGLQQHLEHRKYHKSLKSDIITFIGISFMVSMAVILYIFMGEK